MTTLKQRAEAFLALADRATAGPWASQLEANADAVFIVAAGNDAPALIRDLLAENRQPAVQRDAPLAGGKLLLELLGKVGKARVRGWTKHDELHLRVLTVTGMTEEAKS